MTTYVFNDITIKETKTDYIVIGHHYTPSLKRCELTKAFLEAAISLQHDQISITHHNIPYNHVRYTSEQNPIPLGTYNKMVELEIGDKQYKDELSHYEVELLNQLSYIDYYNSDKCKKIKDKQDTVIVL